MSTPEGKVKLKLREFLKQFEPHLFVAHIPGTGYGDAGMPDYIGAYKGRMFGIEAKAEGKKLTPLQDAKRHVMLRAGAAYFVVVGSEGFDQFKKDFQNWMIAPT